MLLIKVRITPRKPAANRANLKAAVTVQSCWRNRLQGEETGKSKNSFF